jgi:diaminopimelate epimerase
MNGIGNRIAVVDLRAGGAPLSAAEARALARPEAGLDFDQLMALHPGEDTAATVRIYNSDGSAAGACGNGMRCVADVLMRDGAATEIVVDGPAGPLACRRDPRPSFYTVDMGRPRFLWDEIPLARPVADTGAVPIPLDGADADFGPAACAGMGNPHAVFFVADPAAVDLGRWGPAIENHPMFPERVNVSFARVEAGDRIRLRVWERGAGATLACGSAACAAAVLAARTGRTGRAVTVMLPGGALEIRWDGGDHVLMTGPVEREAEGSILRETLAVALEAA